MKDLIIESTFDADAETTFGILTDLPNAPDRIEAILKLEMLTDGPVGLGTKFRETRKMFGKESTEDMTITQFAPNESYTVEAESCGSHYTSRFTFVPNGEQTNVTMSFGAKPLTFMAKLMSPMLFCMRGVLRKCVVKDMADLAPAVAEAASNKA